MNNNNYSNTTFLVLLVNLLVQVIYSSTHTSAVACSGQRIFFVEKRETIDLVSLAFRDAADAVDGANECYWTFMTTGDHILVISSNVSDLFETYVEIYDDGFETTKSSIVSKRKVKNQTVLETGNSVAALRIHYNDILAASLDFPVNTFQLQIEQAVECPSHLGVDENESQCDRIIDLESCYCAIFTKRSWQDHFTYCRIYNMELVSLESLNEEKAIQSSWTSLEIPTYWISLSDSIREGYYIWSSTGAYLYPWGGGIGYVNWASNQPDSASEDDDCIIVNNSAIEGWNDVSCTANYNAICELHPDTNPQSTTTSSNSTSSSTVSTADTSTETPTTTSSTTSTDSSTSTTPSDFTCPEENGFFPIDPYICSPGYYSCVSGIAYPQTCPGTSVFDPNKVKCVRPDKCFICPEQDGDYAIDPKVCSPDYYHCESRVPTLKTCPGVDVAFDPVKHWCTTLSKCTPNRSSHHKF